MEETNITFSIYDKEGRTILEADTEENALYQYQQWAESNASDDGEHYEWTESVEIVGHDDNGEVSRNVRCAIMDSRKDSYDHGKAYFESTRI